MLQAEDDDDDNAHTDQNDSAYNAYEVLYWNRRDTVSIQLTTSH